MHGRTARTLQSRMARALHSNLLLVSLPGLVKLKRRLKTKANRLAHKFLKISKKDNFILSYLLIIILRDLLDLLLLKIIILLCYFY